MSEEIICNKCGTPMENLGNISGVIYTSYPERWDDVYVCKECKEKRTVKKYGTVCCIDNSIEGYKEQEEVPEPKPWKDPFTSSTTITGILIQDLLNGSANYIRNGKVYFNRLIVTDKEIFIYDKNKKLGSFVMSTIFSPGDSITFDMLEGQIGLTIS